MGYTRKTDHADDMVENLLSQDDGRANTEGLVDAIGGEVQELEDAIGDIFDQHFIDAAVGAQLDGLGEIVDEQRSGQTDDDFRVSIKAKAFIIRSQGTPEELISLVRALAGDSVSVAFEELFPATFNIIVGFFQCSAATAKDILDMGPVGVAGSLLCDTSETPFQFSSTANLEPSVTQGFSQDAQTTGGDFSTVFPA